MGQGLFQGNNSIRDENAIAMNNLMDSVENAAGSIGGQQTGITTRSDVLELGLMDMAGIEISTGYPSSMRFEMSEKNPDIMFIDVKGMSENDVQTFTQFLSLEAGYAVDTGAWEGFDNSIEVSISGIQNLMPDLDQHLDDMSPHLIRNFQEQSGQIPSFQGANELRQDPSFSQPGKTSFNQDEQAPVSEVTFEEVRVPVEFSSSGKQGFGDQGGAENRIDIDSSSPGKQEFSGQAIPDNRIDVDFSSPGKQDFGGQGVPENRIDIDSSSPGKTSFNQGEQAPVPETFDLSGDQIGLLAREGIQLETYELNSNGGFSDAGNIEFIDDGTGVGFENIQATSEAGMYQVDLTVDGEVAMTTNIRGEDLQRIQEQAAPIPDNRIDVDFSSSGKQGFGDQGAAENRIDIDSNSPGKTSFNQDEQAPVPEAFDLSGDQVGVLARSGVKLEIYESNSAGGFSSDRGIEFYDDGEGVGFENIRATSEAGMYQVDITVDGKVAMTTNIRGEDLQRIQEQATPIPDNRIDVDFGSPNKQGFGDQSASENRIEIETTQPGKFGFSEDQATNTVTLDSGNDNQLAQTQVSEWNRVGPITEFGGWDVAANGPLGSAVDINGEGGGQPTLTGDAYEPTMLADASAVQGKLIEQPSVEVDVQSDLIQKSTANFSLG